MPEFEDEESYLLRRAAEERAKMRESSCMVRTVHEDMAEEYEERGAAAEAESAALRALAERIP